MARLRLRAIRRLAREAAARLRLREQAKAALLAVGGEVRRVNLEAGRRLTERGVLTEAAEVDLLSPTELRAALNGGETVTPDVIAHRRRWQARYSQDGPLPPRFTGRPAREAVDSHTGRRHEGWAASPGRFRGRAVVVTSPRDHLPQGAVLVAEATDPSWSPLFFRAGALVLDRGGPLSHAAILARELGMPAVLNVPGATTLLAGHDVTVDGDAGVVVVHDLADGEAGPEEAMS
jgi:pyruvate,water dikinase